jgi:K+-transporting ATPase KdpF subunit
MTLLTINAETFSVAGAGGYLVVAIIALLVLGYLVFALFNPDKF